MNTTKTHDIKTPEPTLFPWPYKIKRSKEDHSEVEEGEEIWEVSCGEDVIIWGVTYSEADILGIPANATGKLIIILTETNESNTKIGEIIEKV